MSVELWEVRLHFYDLHSSLEGNARCMQPLQQKNTMPLPCSIVVDVAALHGPSGVAMARLPGQHGNKIHDNVYGHCDGCRYM